MCLRRRGLSGMCWLKGNELLTRCALMIGRGGSAVGTRAAHAVRAPGVSMRAGDAVRVPAVGMRVGDAMRVPGASMRVGDAIRVPGVSRCV